jgi:hypothetical protein
MHVHMKVPNHEAHGSNFVGGTRKKPSHNPDEVGAVKDHFSEGRQQEYKRQPPKQNAEAKVAAALAAPEAPQDNPWRISHAHAAQQAALALGSLLKEAAAPEARQDAPAAIAAHHEQSQNPSLDDLLALMRTKP